MGEINKQQESNNTEESNKKRTPRKMSTGPEEDDYEGENERNLARAALSISELGEMPHDLARNTELTKPHPPSISARGFGSST